MVDPADHLAGLDRFGGARRGRVGIGRRGRGDQRAAAGPTGGARAIAAAIIVGLGLVNLLGIRFGARFEIGVTAVKFLFLGGMLVTAAVATALRAAAPEATAAAEGAAASLPAMPHNALGLAAVLGSAMVSIIFTYDGYADAVYMAGETRAIRRARCRARSPPRCSLSRFFTSSRTWSFIVGLGVPAMAQSKFVGRDLARAAFAGAGIAAFAAVGLVVMAGAVNSYLLTGPRIARLLAEEGLAAPAFGVVGGRGVPVVATLWLVAVSLVLLFTNSFEELLELTVPVIWLTNLAVAAGLLVQRRRAPERPRPFRVPAAGWLVGAQILIGVGCLASVRRVLRVEREAPHPWDRRGGDRGGARPLSPAHAAWRKAARGVALKRRRARPARHTW